MPAKSQILTICTFRSQVEEFDFLYNEYEVKKKKKCLNPGQIPKDLIKLFLIHLRGRGGTIQPIYSCHKNNLIP